MKPYVPYDVADITQGPFTVQDLFNSTYAHVIEEAYRDGKLEDPEAARDKLLNPAHVMNPDNS